MRLLTYSPTSPGRLSFYDVSQESDVPPYAILSHRWGPIDEEITYDDILSGNPLLKPGCGSEKLRFCIRQILKDRLQHFWIDTCCIDKRNNTELSKAIISMYRWYASAQICYAYLDGQWQTSSWWKRGWTLQELMAPQHLEFFEQGVSVGTKVTRITEVSAITSIPVAALQGGATTLAERRRWQEGRSTTQKEDIVYSLLGLLGISMAILYGEGTARAQQRLQHEIDLLQKGSHYRDYSLPFSLAQAPIERQFVARTGELHEIRCKLQGDGRRVVVLHGLGGIGKTQLSLAYAQQYRECYSAVFWLNAKSLETLKSSFVVAGKLIVREHRTDKLADIDFEKPDTVVEGVKAWLSTAANTAWLILYDNYDEPDAFDLQQYMPESQHGSAIVTTRSQGIPGDQIHVRKLGLSSSVEILRKKSGTKDDPTELARRLDGLPLALATAGAFIGQMHISCTQYLRFMDKEWAKLQRTSPKLNTYDQSLYTTWQISFDQIEWQDRKAANVLRLWAYFDNQDIWYELLKDHEGGPEWFRSLVEDQFTFTTTMGLLCQHGLVEVGTVNDIHNQESMSYSIHPCVHDWTTAVLNAGFARELAEISMSCVSQHIPDIHQESPGQVIRRLLNHGRQCTSHLKAWGLGKADVKMKLGSLYLQSGDYSLSCTLLNEALRELRPLHSKDRRKLAMAIMMLGSAYAGQGNLIRAEQLYKESGNKLMEDYGRHSAALHEVRYKLAVIFMQQKRLAEAEKLFQDVQEGSAEVGALPSAEHYVLMSNLAHITFERGDRVDGLSRMTLAVEGHRRLRGANAGTVELANTLAGMYFKLGRLHDAERIYSDNLAMKEAEYSSTHPAAVVSRVNLGAVYCQQRRLEEAQSLITDALHQAQEGSEAQALAANNLGIVYKQQSRLDEAETSLKRAYALNEKIFGTNHISNVMPLANLSAVYQQRGQTDEGIKVCLEALTTLGRGSEDEHAQRVVLENLYLLGSNHESLGKVDKALAAYEACFQACVKHLGMQNVLSERLYQCLGRMYQRLGRSLADEVTAAKYYSNMAALLVLKGNTNRAESNLLRAFNAGLKTGDPSFILQTATNLRRLYVEAGLPEALISTFEVDGPLAGLDLSTIVTQICSAISCVQAYSCTILQASARKGHLELSRVLIQIGSDVNAARGALHCALIEAAHYGFLAIVRLLLDSGADVNAQSKNGAHALYDASEYGHLNVIKLLCDSGADVNTAGGYYGNALQCASASSQADVVELLISYGADVCAYGGRWGRALQAAAHAGHNRIVRYLLDHGADVNAAGGPERFAILTAAARGHAEVVELLLQHGADVNAFGGWFGRPLQAAADLGHLDVARVLLAHNVNQNAPGGWYEHALAAAAWKNQLEIAKLLVDADVNAFCGQWGTALDCAAQRGCPELVQLLLDRGATVVHEVGLHGNPLQTACYEGRLDNARLLLDRGAPVNQEGGHFGRALQAACHSGSLETVKLLLDRGADVNAKGSRAGSALSIAAWKGHVEIVKLLLPKADVKAVVGPQGSVLVSAAWQGHLEVVKLLLPKADINASSKPCGPAVQAAAERGHLEVVKFLLSKGADITTRRAWFGYPLQAAATMGHVQIAQCLIAAGADINAKGGYHHCAVRAAVYSDSLAMLECLVAHGVDVDEREGRQYNTALWVAVERNHLDMVTALVAAGADVNLQPDCFSTPLCLAKERGLSDIVAVLVEAGAYK